MIKQISVNIPVRAGGNISTVLNSLKKVNYSKDSFEIIKCEGNQIAIQRNLALDISKGSIVYLLDDDSIVNKNALKIIAKHFKNSKVAAVGGPSLPSKSGGNYISYLIGVVLETYFGAMRMRYRYSKQKSKKGTEYRCVLLNYPNNIK